MVLWILRIIACVLIFVVVWLGVPYALAFIAVAAPPDNLLKAVAGLIALGWLFGDLRYGWTSRWGPPPAA